MEGAWVSLFSGGKDSSWALYRALERGCSVERLVTVHPSADSYLYHVPATSHCSLAAESIGIPITHVRTPDFGADRPVDASSQGDTELEPLEEALQHIATELDDGLSGVIAGAVESEFQRSRIQGMADRLGIDVYEPLWQRNPPEVAREMVDAGFDIRIVQVAADGLDEPWLDRRYDGDALEALETLNERRGVHVLGEGGEFETLVVDGPHMSRPIEYEGHVEWDGNRGRVIIEDAWLGNSA